MITNYLDNYKQADTKGRERRDRDDDDDSGEEEKGKKKCVSEEQLGGY